MTLQEFTTRLQSLCHDGWATKEVEFVVNGETVHPEELSLRIESDAFKGGVMYVDFKD